MSGRPLSYLATLPIDVVKGIGPKIAKRLNDVGINSVAHLLLHTPRRYLDRSQLFNLASVPLGEEVTIGGTVMRTNTRRISKKRVLIDADISDGTNVVHAMWFNPYLRIETGEEIALSGKVERFKGRLQMKSPDIDRLGDESLITGRVVPVHPAVGKTTAFRMRSWIANALARAQPIQEVVPEPIIERLGLIERSVAFQDIHFPEELGSVEPARQRLIFDELFRLETALALRKQQQLADASGVTHDIDGHLVDMFVAALPYELTGAQQRSIQEIQNDMASKKPMHRLLQGEVGSGKTVVAFAGLLTSVQGGFQGAVMAPTEVLAEQHYLGMEALIEEAGMHPEGIMGTTSGGDDAQPDLFSLQDGDDTADATIDDSERPMVTMALLTGSQAVTNFATNAKRRDVLRWIGDGTIDLVIGTHALIQEGVHFDRLGMAVVDEQHRFGVFQRVQLREKADDYDPDVLIMTATPIPRTLSMTLYGDLDVSILDEMPPGRTPVATRLVSKGSENEVYQLIRSEVANGRQAFVVCPLVDDSDKLEASSATAEHARLSAVFDDLTVGLLHGQMRPDEKDAAMSAFRRGDIDVLVATTVIEVGIDVPNATVMVIEDADRFGLSQLHQLRGRVGRGAHASTCVLVADPATDDGIRRMEAMVATTDGFLLAEEDLRIRGQGTVFGARQAGMKDLKLADILRDAETLIAARREAFALVAEDPGLEHHPDLREEIDLLLGTDDDWLLRS